MAERWRPIPGFDGLYEISTLAEVRSWRIVGGVHKAGERSESPKILSPTLRKRKNRNPVLEISLWNGEAKSSPLDIKMLMRDIWMEGPKPGKIVKLIDGDPSNCALHNLRYTTLGEMNKKKGNSLRKPIAKYNEHHEVITFYRSIYDAAKKNFLTESGMRNRIRRGTVVDGYYFTYAN